MRRRIKKFKSLGQFLPDEFLGMVLPAKVWRKNFVIGSLDELGVQKKIVKTIAAQSAITKKDLSTTINGVLREYKRRGRALAAAGVAAYRRDAINDGALLKQRVRDAVVYAEVVAQKEKHRGQYYRWLPSSANEPDPEHQALYGQVFKVGTGDKDGNMPGERYGCQCGIEWLDVDE